MGHFPDGLLVLLLPRFVLHSLLGEEHPIRTNYNTICTIFELTTTLYVLYASCTMCVIDPRFPEPKCRGPRGLRGPSLESRTRRPRCGSPKVWVSITHIVHEAYSTYSIIVSLNRIFFPPNECNQGCASTPACRWTLSACTSEVVHSIASVVLLHCHDVGGTGEFLMH